MSNPINFEADVLSSSPAEIEQIEHSLAHIGWEVVCKLGYVHPSVNKARRLSRHSCSNSWEADRDGLLKVSAAFPLSIFLLTYCDMQWSYSGQYVVRAGEVVQQIYDGDQQAQALDWALLDIFAPFRAEYEIGLEFGSLWARWLDDVATIVASLKDVNYPPRGLGDKYPSGIT